MTDGDTVHAFNQRTRRSMMSGFGPIIPTRSAVVTRSDVATADQSRQPATGRSRGIPIPRSFNTETPQGEHEQLAEPIVVNVNVPSTEAIPAVTNANAGDVAKNSAPATNSKPTVVNAELSRHCVLNPVDLHLRDYRMYKQKQKLTTKPKTKTTPNKPATLSSSDDIIWFARQATAAAFILATTLWFFETVQNTKNGHLFQGMEDWYRTWIQGWFDIEKIFWEIAQYSRAQWDRGFLQTCTAWEDIVTQLHFALVYLTNHLTGLDLIDNGEVITNKYEF